MPRYAGTGSMTSAAGTSRAVLTGSAAVRPKLYDFTISQTSATPADNVNEYQLQRVTTTGTTTSVTLVAGSGLDPATTGTPVATIGINATIEPTYTTNAILYRFSHNMRATFRWIAGPLGEMVLAATASNGLGLLFNASNSAFSDVLTLHWEE